MGGQNGHVSTFGDWGAPSPSPRTFFSSLLGDDISSRQILENNNTMLYSSKENVTCGNNENDKSSCGLNAGEYTRLDMYSHQKLDSREGLLERMAARAGFIAPNLTEGVRPKAISQNQDGRSTFLTIPPGLSPTTLLESPVFLSNALAQPSPTTGKFPFALGGINNRNFSLAPDGHDKNRENFYGDARNSSFSFRPVPESGDSSFLVPANINFPGFKVSRTVASTENSSPLDDQQDDEGCQEHLPGGAPAEDGYNWRKYGQKQVKGSQYPRSYYKCTHPNCPVKKKVERSHEGHITEIIYKGAHIHPKLSINRRPGAGTLLDLQAHDSLEVTSSASVEAKNFRIEGDVADRASVVSNDDNEEEDDRATHGSASLVYDGEEDESESKRR